MNRFALILLLIAGCSPSVVEKPQVASETAPLHDVPTTSKQTKGEISKISPVSTWTKFDEAWVLSEAWTGFMGIAIVFKDNEFKYWFYSDVIGPNEPTYPLTGKVEREGDTIILIPDSDADFYDTKWHVVDFQGEICLLADFHMQEYRESSKLPEDRLLHKLDSFDEKHPVKNMPRKPQMPKFLRTPLFDQ